MPRARSRANHSAESELAFLSIQEAARLLRRKEISPLELVESALARIARLNSALNAFITVVPELALRAAKIAQREITRGKSKGPLHGIPISLKDNIWTRGIRTTAGSKILADFVPSDDADVAKSLSRAGAILLGKTNMHEFAYGVTNENPPSVRRAILGIANASRAARAAARRRPSPAACVSRRSALTRAARFEFRRRCAASWD
jgi:Asp-tRNA(Asn)/Glu-tRNA(Gln) amidotransferase A subunit family amidase